MAYIVVDGFHQSAAPLVRPATGRGHVGDGPEDLQRLTRMAVTPSVVRFVCRAAIERGLRPDATGSANEPRHPRLARTNGNQHRLRRGRPESTAADGEDEVAERRWGDHPRGGC